MLGFIVKNSHLFLKGMHLFYKFNLFLFYFGIEVICQASFEKENCVKSIFRALTNVNILYVKVLQSICNNKRWLSKDLNDFVVSYTDNAPWSYNDIPIETLIELSNDFDINFKNGFENPSKAGMVSLIYDCIDNNNKPIIIKIKRNNISEKISEGLKDIQYLIELLSFVPIIKNLKIADFFHRNTSFILNQLDFEKETRNLIRIQKECKYLEYIKIPTVYEYFSNKYPNIIVMEKIEGYTIKDLPKEYYIPFSKLIVKFGIVSMLKTRFIHADLHPGNIFFIKEKDTLKLGIIDFGIIYEIKEEERNEMVEIMAGIFTEPISKTADKCLKSHFIEPESIIQTLSPICYNGLKEELINLLSGLLENKEKMHFLVMFEFIEKLSQFLQLPEAKKLNLKLGNAIYIYQMCMSMAHGITMTLCGDKYMDITKEVINDIFSVFDNMDEED